MVVAGASSIAYGGTRYNAIALSGDVGTNRGLGPNAGAGVNFRTFEAPVISATGEVAVVSWIDGPGIIASYDSGIWSNVGGTIQAVARAGEGGLGPNVGAGVYFSGFAQPVIQPGGKIAFSAGLYGAGISPANNTGIWSNSDGMLVAVARTGALGQGPGVGPGVSFSAFTAPRLNPAGEVAFSAYLAGAPDEGLGLYDQGIWSNVGGTMAVVGRTGRRGPGPNLGNGVFFSEFSYPSINDSGQIAFLATLYGRVGSDGHTGIWSNVSGDSRVVARSGSAGPGPNLGAGVDFIILSVPAINSSGAIAFSGELTGAGINSTNSRGVWVSTNGSISSVARAGDPGLGPNVGPGIHFGGVIYAPLINSAGQVAFKADLVGTGINSTNDGGIWTNVGGTLNAVAREGNIGPGPGLGSDIHFSQFDSLVFNASGEVAFVGTVTGPGIHANNARGIWTNVGGNLTKIVRSGDLFDIDPSEAVDWRTIGGFRFSTYESSGGEDGRRTGFSDGGVLAFTLYFTDGTSGVFTAIVPEPTALLTLAMLPILMFRLRRG